MYIRGGSSFFPRGGGGVWPIVHEPRSGEPIFYFGYFTSREAASRFFWRFYEPQSGEPIFFFAILRAAKRRADFFWAILRAAKRRADFFLGYIEPP